MSAKKIAYHCAAIFLLGPSISGAQQTNDPPTSRIVSGAQLPTRVAHPPVIDGRDDDEAWRAAAPITAFRMFDPTEDADPAFRTEARIAYDDANLYFFIRAF